VRPAEADATKDSSTLRENRRSERVSARNGALAGIDGAGDDGAFAAYERAA